MDRISHWEALAFTVTIPLLAVLHYVYYFFCLYLQPKSHSGISFNLTLALNLGAVPISAFLWLEQPNRALYAIPAWLSVASIHKIENERWITGLNKLFFAAGSTITIVFVARIGTTDQQFISIISVISSMESVFNILAVHSVKRSATRTAFHRACDHTSINHTILHICQFVFWLLMFILARLGKHSAAPHGLQAPICLWIISRALSVANTTSRISSTMPDSSSTLPSNETALGQSADAERGLEIFKSGVPSSQECLVLASTGFVEQGLEIVKSDMSSPQEWLVSAHATPALSSTATNLAKQKVKAGSPTSDKLATSLTDHRCRYCSRKGSSMELLLSHEQGHLLGFPSSFVQIGSHESKFLFLKLLLNPLRECEAREDILHTCTDHVRHLIVEEWAWHCRTVDDVLLVAEYVASFEGTLQRILQNHVL